MDKKGVLNPSRCELLRDHTWKKLKVI